MRDLKKSDRNILRIADARSGTEIELYYRTPGTAEEVDYQKSLVRRENGKVQECLHETRLEKGLGLLTGFREGDFGYDGSPISSDESSPLYRADWKDLLRETASDIVTTLAYVVFEGQRVVRRDELPLQKS